MKRISLLLCLVCSFMTYAQGTKTKKVNKKYYTEYFTMVKKTSVKDGRYFRLNNMTLDTLITGTYKNGERGGEWTFYDNKGKLYLQYNYDSKSVMYLSDTIKAIDKFFIKTDSVFKFTVVDRAPIYLSDADDVYRTLATNIVLPGIIAKQNIKGKSIASFEIDKEGNLVNIEIKQSLHPELDKMISETIGKLNEGWLPAIKDGKPVVAGYVLVVNVLPSDERAPKVTELPFMFTLTIFYYGKSEIKFN